MARNRFDANEKYARMAGLQNLKSEIIEGDGKGYSSNKKGKQGSARQICLAFHYMRKNYALPRKSGITLIDAEFMSFITGLSTDNLRKMIANPLEVEGDDKDGKKAKSLLDDLKKVKFQFEKILFAKGLELINKDIEKYENTIKSYKTDK